MVDIKEGNVLVVSGKEYTVRAVGTWVMSDKGNSRSFLKLASVTASIKQPGEIVDGKRGLPEFSQTGLTCTPLDPVTAETQISMGIQGPFELLQTFLADEDGYYQVFIEQAKK